MTLYAGETIQVRHRGEDYEGNALTSVEVDASITIWDLDDTVLVNEAQMTYDGTLVFDDGNVGGWYYLWTSPTIAGAYLARMTITGTNIDAWEYKTIRLRRDKAPVV